jgi:hypothetical protein
MPERGPTSGVTSIATFTGRSCFVRAICALSALSFRETSLTLPVARHP